jgi:hypothetical protein
LLVSVVDRNLAVAVPLKDRRIPPNREGALPALVRIERASIAIC